MHSVLGWAVNAYKVPIPAPVCYFSVFLVYSCSMMLICATTTDRLIAVTKPLHAARYCTESRARVVSVVIMIIGGVYSIPHFFATRWVDNDRCTSYAVDTLVVKVYGFVTSLSNLLLPFVALMTMKTLISLKLPNSSNSTSYFTDVSEVSSDVRTTVKSGVTFLSINEVGQGKETPQRNMLGGEQRDHSSGSRDQERQLIVMLLCVSFVFLVLTLPIYIR